MKKIVNLSIILISLIILELFSQLLLLTLGEKKYSILVQPFINSTQQTFFPDEYKINWNFAKNKMIPGIYENEEIQYTINSKGFRGKEFKTFKEKYRIICFGGSSTIGLKSPDDQTYPAILEKKLNDKSNKYEVLNFGFGSKSLNFIKSLFFREAVNYKPDAISIYSNRNSIMYDSGKVDIQLISNHKFLKLNFFLMENIMTYRVVSKTYKRLYNLTLNQKFINNPYSNTKLSEKYFINGYINSLKEIIDYSNLNKIDVYLIKQAYYFNPKISFELEKYDIQDLISKLENNFLIKNYDVNETEQFWLITGTILNKNLDHFKDYSNVTIVDPLKALLSDKDNFIDYIHLTPKGNEILAKEIFREISKKLKNY